MLRTVHSRVPLLAPLSRYQQLRSFSVGAPTGSCLNTSSSNSGKSAADEDKEELERERLLRERFAQKVQQGVPQSGGGGFDSTAFGAGAFNQGGGAQGMPFGTNAVPMPNMDTARRMFNFFFYLTAFMFLLLLVPLANLNSPMYTMQGLAWWQLPISSAAYFLLLRVIYPRSEQNRIKADFEVASRLNPRLTFHEYMAQYNPSMFQGYRTSQPEVVAAVAACMAAATDFKFAKTMTRAAGRAKDPKLAVDNVVDALRRDFPTNF